MNNFHNIAVKMCDSLMKQNHSIAQGFYKHDDAVKNEYRLRLNASVDASRYLLQQGIPFRAHDESENSGNKGNFLELIRYTADQNKAVRKVVLKNAQKNNQMPSPPNQKDIVHCIAEEIVKSIIEEVDHGIFGLLVDESTDISHKEQMAVVLCFVDKDGNNQRKIYWGQGYDGASNMRGEFNVGASCKRQDVVKEKYRELQEFNDRFTKRSSLEQQLAIYIDNIREDGRFHNLESLGDLSRLMVETRKHLAHPLVYRLLKLALTSPVATATVERCFSSMKFVKTASRNRIGDQFLSDCLV
uniref:DUF4371 domain-containing protein n=1 Tax=Brassica oleracea var. oleracea TaxID=109376 RepID=A0A0D3BVU7_BRAOL